MTTKMFRDLTGISTQGSAWILFEFILNKPSTKIIDNEREREFQKLTKYLMVLRNCDLGGGRVVTVIVVIL